MSNIINIGIFGRRNVGKSSIVNSLLGQDFAIVSDVPGTTTDPVQKRLEIFGLGPCNIVDTAGIDDLGELGEMRVARTREVIARIDAAILVFQGNEFAQQEQELMDMFARYSLPVVLLHNKMDVARMDEEFAASIAARYNVNPIEFSAKLGGAEKDAMVEYVVAALKAVIDSSKYTEHPMFDGIVSAGQRVLLVCPIDAGAPTGRLILPQVMAIRGLLDIGALVSVARPDCLAGFFVEGMPSFDLVVTDSSVFGEVNAAIPANIPLTSFSMLLARSKGCFEQYCQGTSAISALKDGDRILILESCTHHTSCDDIGRVKIPMMMRKFTGRELEFDVVSGLDTISHPIGEYALVLQCGGCMITKRQLFSRLLPAIEAGVPVTNYGMSISYMKGIYDRALQPLL